MTEAVLEQYTVVVSTDQGQAQVMQISEFCHARNIQFIVTRTWGLYGFIFNDFVMHLLYRTAMMVAE